MATVQDKATALNLGQSRTGTEEKNILEPTPKDWLNLSWISVSAERERG